MSPLTPYDQTLPVCEDEVCELVAGWFDTNDFKTDWVKAGRRGLDIEATHRQTGQRFIVEAKGATTSKRDSLHHGREYDQNGAYNRVSQAFWMASRWVCLELHKDANVGIALPSTYHFDNHSKPIENACRLLGIAIFRVDFERKITTVPANLAANAHQFIPRPKELLSAPDQLCPFTA
ncbi:hypothetical protein OIU34_00035 [Pararhizobium sp. BT-229]|uniref:hypothetical protein n=1 Tax=Pararhizobium sp. BT-229 TaxID=2986923 RepID=UPI0021F6D3E9|nr:hypothetical protein [Pararhizobium sp. BT-229]MCV9960276.1 hypothetical protein [Pararhizobium sp. BT-229]